MRPPKCCFSDLNRTFEDSEVPSERIAATLVRCGGLPCHGEGSFIWGAATTRWRLGIGKFNNYEEVQLAVLWVIENTSV